jgi:hypothetical protein
LNIKKGKKYVVLTLFEEERSKRQCDDHQQESDDGRYGQEHSNIPSVGTISARRI